jgi:hypothetical protein
MIENGYRYTHDRLEQILEVIWSIHCDMFTFDGYNDTNCPRPMIYKFVQFEDFEN